MKLVKIIGAVIGGLVLIILILGLFANRDSKVEKSITINAPKNIIWDQIAMFENFNQWSPWSARDPQMKYEISGTDGQLGAMYTWSGNDSVGKGSMEITAITEEKLDVQLAFITPMGEMKPMSYYTFLPNEEGMNVSWGFESHSPYPLNAFNLFMDMESSVGKDFEKGLKKLKKRCEMLAEEARLQAEKEKMPVYNVAEGTHDGMTVIGIKKKLKISTEMEKFFTESYPIVFNLLSTAKLNPMSTPMALYFTWDEENDQCEATAGVLVAPNSKVKGLETLDIAASKMLTIDYYGDYEKMKDVHMAMDEYITGHSLKIIAPVMEQYIDSPESQPDASKRLTKVIYFVE